LDCQQPKNKPCLGHTHNKSSVVLVDVATDTNPARDHQQPPILFYAHILSSLVHCCRSVYKDLSTWTADVTPHPLYAPCAPETSWPKKKTIQASPLQNAR